MGPETYRPSLNNSGDIGTDESGLDRDFNEDVIPPPDTYEIGTPGPIENTAPLEGDGEAEEDQQQGEQQ